MEIIKSDYLETKEATLRELTAYFDDNLGEGQLATSDDAMLKPMREFSFIAEHDGVICGRISGEVDTFNSTLRINGLIVNSEIRGTGAGRLLMDAAESLGIAAGCHLCFVNTTESTAPGFYDKLGYRRIASVNDYPVPGDTYYYYFKQIS